MKKTPRFSFVILIALGAMLSACTGSTRTEDTPIAIWGPKRVLPVRLSEGSAMARSGSKSNFEPISVGQSFSSGDEIQTGHDGRVVLELFHEGLVVLSANTHVKITSLESIENQDVYHFSLIGGEVFFVDGATKPPDTLDGLATSPAIVFDIETNDGVLTLFLPAGRKGREEARLASISSAPEADEIVVTCFTGECLLSNGTEQTNIPEGELAILKRRIKSTEAGWEDAKPSLILLHRWSRDNGSVISVLEFAGVDSFHFDVPGLEISSYAAVHKVEGLVEAGFDSDYAAVAEGKLLGDGHSLHTDANSRAALHLADGAVLAVGEHSTVHFANDAEHPQAPGVHVLLEHGELYLMHTGVNPVTNEWVIDLPGDVAIVAQPNPDNYHMGLHVSYDPESDDLVITLLDGQATLMAGDQAVELPLGKRSEVKDSHDRYANIEINMRSKDMDEPEFEDWRSTLIFSEVNPESFEILETP